MTWSRGTAVRRRWGYARVAEGGLILLATRGLPPDRGRGRRPGLRTAAQVLGARDLLQGVLVSFRPTSGTMRAAAAVDALHLATMLGLATLRHRHRGGVVIAVALATAAVSGDLIVMWIDEPNRVRPRPVGSAVPRR
jgi:hypothetical protein